jgi:hypothetical protein
MNKFWTVLLQALYTLKYYDRKDILSLCSLTLYSKQNKRQLYVFKIYLIYGKYIHTLLPA